jgi:RHS repeat-associated protein
MDDPTTTGVTEGFGLMFYNARWYDPYLNHFTQPDSIVPDPYNPQDWNRYSYARNNPIRYTDPSGHRPCEDGNCEINPLAYRITYGFGWILNGDDWTGKELQTIFATGNKIKNYVDGLTDGKGNEWINQHLGNTTIEHASWADSHGETWPKWFVGGAKISLGKNWLNDPWGAKVLFAHELGHVWDINSNFGASYLMNLDLGGSGVCLFCNPGDGVPKWGLSYHPDGPDAYGNSGRNEYFAEAFAAAIYNRGTRGVVSSAVAWIDNNIPVPLYFNPWTGQR